MASSMTGWRPIPTSDDSCSAPIMPHNPSSLFFQPCPTGLSAHFANPLCHAFYLLSCSTWVDIHDMERLPEESITDYRLLQLARTCPNSITVHKFTRRSESATGADWEWWFGSPGSWFGMRVQAKRLWELTPNFYSYSHLDYKRKRRGQLTYQIDTLISDAANNNTFPAYSFYNFWQAGISPSFPCGSEPSAIHQLGITIADARAVLPLAKSAKKSLLDIAPVSYPLKCLACCAPTTLPTTNLAERVRNVASQLSEGTYSPPSIQRNLPAWAGATTIDSPHHRKIPPRLAGILIVRQS